MTHASSCIFATYYTFLYLVTFRIVHCVIAFLIVITARTSNTFVVVFFFFLMIRRPPRSTQSRSSAASDVYKRQDLKRLRRRMQIVFQDPVGSLNPRMPVSDIIGEGLVAQADRENRWGCLLYTSPSPRDRTRSRMPSSA